jgi:hypothetical protein
VLLEFGLCEAVERREHGGGDGFDGETRTRTTGREQALCNTSRLMPAEGSVERGDDADRRSVSMGAIPSSMG